MAKSFILAVFLPALVLNTVDAQNQGSSSCRTPNGRIGMCIGLRQCQPLLSLLQTQPLEARAIAFLKQSQCGFVGNVPRVCCDATGTISLQAENTNDQTPDEEIVYDLNLNYDLSNNPLLPNDCGKDLSQRIFGGERTELDEFPWMALLEYTRRFGKTITCGGVLISRRYVLTAAHCLVSKEVTALPLESVRLGEYNTDTDVDCVQDGETTKICADPVATIGIEEQFVHEKYQTREGQKYDIGLIRLNRDVEFSNYIKPICLPQNAIYGPKVVVAGWGRTENGTSSAVKLKLTLPIADWDKCRETYRKLNIPLGYGQICAGGQVGKDSCRGDSGGPLMTLKRSNDGIGRWSVIGVVSFGPMPCGLPDFPGVYTRVIDYVPWILSKMRP